MKSVVKLAAVLSVLVFTSFTVNADTNVEKIGYINVAHAFQNHPSREDVAKKLEAEFDAPSKKLQQQEKVIIAKIENLEKEAANLRRADIQKKSEEINKLRDILAQDAQQLEAKMIQRQEEEQRKLLLSLQTATTKIAKEKGFTLVLDENAVLYAVDGKDVTEEVIKQIQPIK